MKSQLYWTCIIMYFTCTEIYNKIRNCVLQNLTEFNTAHNRRINSMMEKDGPAPNPLKRKHKSQHVFFHDEEEVINPGKMVHSQKHIEINMYVCILSCQTCYKVG